MFFFDRLSWVLKAWTLLPALVVPLWAGEPKAESSVEQSRETRAPTSPLRISCRPGRAFTGGLVTLELVWDGTRGPDGEAARSQVQVSGIRWRTTAGRLHSDDLARVRWRAPAEPRTVRIEVEARIGEIPRTASTEIEVVEPSTEGMVWIPPKTFIRGDIEGTRDTRETKTNQNANDEPFHEVTLDGYWIDRYPVTNESYRTFLQDLFDRGLARVEEGAVMGEYDEEWVPFYYLESYERLLWELFATKNARRPRFERVMTVSDGRVGLPAGFERHPVTNVTWYGAKAYAASLGRTLPTEAQWELAARGTDGRRFPWGHELPTPYLAPITVELAPVGAFSPAGDSPFGVSDMLSGTFEWTDDWMNWDYYADHFALAPHVNPLGPFWGRAHAIRGFPSAIQYQVPSIARADPITLRYEWVFDHMVGDCYGDQDSSFRTVHNPRKVARLAHEAADLGTGAPRLPLGRSGLGR